MTSSEVGRAEQVHAGTSDRLLVMSKSLSPILSCRICWRLDVILKGLFDVPWQQIYVITRREYLMKVRLQIQRSFECITQANKKTTIMFSSPPMSRSQPRRLGACIRNVGMRQHPPCSASHSQHIGSAFFSSAQFRCQPEWYCHSPVPLQLSLLSSDARRGQAGIH